MNEVELVGHYGGDETHALSAWTSTRREIDEERRGRIGALLAMLAQSDPEHGSPFEKSYLHFVIRVEAASHIHLLKHRIGVSINAESARYKQHRDDHYYVPEDWPDDLRQDLGDWARESFARYRNALDRLEDAGVTRKRAKESARFFLPYAAQLRMDIGFNFRSFMHFQRLRNHPAAQEEIADIAARMLEEVRRTGAFDLSLAAFGWG